MNHIQRPVFQPMHLLDLAHPFSLLYLTTPDVHGRVAIAEGMRGGSHSAGIFQLLVVMLGG
jgi:hypothetical protein